MSGSGSALHGTVLGEDVADPVEVFLLTAVLGQHQQIFAGSLCLVKSAQTLVSGTGYGSCIPDLAEGIELEQAGTGRFLCNIALYSIGPCFYHQSHPQLGIVFALSPTLHSFWSYFSTDLQ